MNKTLSLKASRPKKVNSCKEQ